MNRSFHGHRDSIPALVRAFCAAALAVPLAAAAGSGIVPHAFSLVATPTPAQAYQLHAPLVQGPDGLLYGAGWYGGEGDDGTVFRVESDGTITVLHVFDGTDGSQLPTGLVVGADGWLYGTTQFGGGPDGRGVVFKISTAGEFVLLHTFSKNLDGGQGWPSGRMVQDAQGNFFGTLCQNHVLPGALFKMTPDGSVTIVHRFQDQGDGSCPDALAMGPDDTIYGTTAYTNDDYGGTLFSYPAAGGRLRTLHTFVCASDGCQPYGLLAIGPDKAIYGAAPLGGTDGVGTVYRVGYNGNFSVIYNFTNGGALGQIPQGGLTQDATGTLYSTTEFGGRNGGGVVFAMTRNGTGHVLHAFGRAKSANGYNPVSSDRKSVV